MKRMLEHPSLYAVVTTLAQAVIGLPLTPNRAIIIEYPSPMLWCGISLLTEISQGLSISELGDFGIGLHCWPRHSYAGRCHCRHNSRSTRP